MNVNTQVQLASYPEGVPRPENFSLVETPVEPLADGEVLCESLYLSLDPYMRIQIAGRHISGSLSPGDTMRGEAICRVVESRNPEFSEGDLVRCMAGWQRYSMHSIDALQRIPELPNPCYALSVLGMPGLTAYAGLIWQAAVKEGDVVAVPAATGGVGAVVGQLAKIHGATVVGIAGSDEKCRYAMDELGYDHCINRHSNDVEDQIKTLCPNGIDIYFDLVGGELLDIASRNLAPGARVVLCGLIADYNSTERHPGPPPGNWIVARATVYGLVVYDFEPRREEFLQACLPWVESGKLKARHDISDGLASAPQAFCRLMSGGNNGKVVVRL